MGPGRNMSSVPKDKFPRLLKSLLKKMEPNASANVKAGFAKCGIIPIDKEQVLKMLPAENIETENPTDPEAQERQHLDNAFINLLKSMRYDGTAKPKKKSKLNVPPGKSIAVEDLEDPAVTSKVKPKRKPKRKLKTKIQPRKKIKIEEDCSESSQHSQSDSTTDDEYNDDLASEISHENPDEANNSSDDDQIMETYPFPTKAEEIKTDNWLAVKFFYSVNKPCSSKNNARTYILVR